MTPRPRASTGAWINTLRGLGIRNLSLRALHQVRLRSGWYERTLPGAGWESLEPQGLDSARAVFPTPPRAVLQPHIADPQQAIEAGRRIADGECLYFSSRWLARPDDWRTNPLTGFTTPLEHWSSLPTFAGEEQGDVKWIWESSRFDWVYQLGRAWAAAEADEEAESFAEAFWEHLESWREHNPPNTGINWVCGQECAFRLIALVWAAGSLGQAQCSTDRRMAQLWEVVVALAQRIDRAMAYALSQNNNHGLSEAAALFLAGTALPSHPLAGQWYGKGMRHFLSETNRQFESDGGYAQHSMNYARVALRDAFVFITALRFNEDEVPPLLRDRVAAAAELLYQVQDPETGQVPNYGPNDGANVFSLSGCLYEDFRPLLQLLSWQLDDRRLFTSGPWDEELVWHYGPRVLDEPPRPRRRRSFGRETSGYFGIRGERSFGLVRCHSFSNRPGHADMLHLDLWIDGLNVLPDRGTYSYNDPDDWGLALKGTACHNTVTVEGQDQMTPGSRFLWLDWTRSRLHSFGRHSLPSWDGWLFDGEHMGYTRQGLEMVHRRRVLQSGDEWLVVDDLTPEGSAPRNLTLRWLIHNQAAEDLTLEIFGPGDSETLEGESSLPGNGVSRTYGELTPHKLVQRSVKTSAATRWVTAVGATVDHCEEGLKWKGLLIPLAAGKDIV